MTRQGTEAPSLGAYPAKLLSGILKGHPHSSDPALLPTLSNRCVQTTYTLSLWSLSPAVTSYQESDHLQSTPETNREPITAALHVPNMSYS